MSCGTGWWRRPPAARIRSGSGVPPSGSGGRCAPTPSVVGVSPAWTSPEKRGCAAVSRPRPAAPTAWRRWWGRSTPPRCCPSPRVPPARARTRRPSRAERQGPRSSLPLSPMPSTCSTRAPATRPASATPPGSRPSGRPAGSPRRSSARRLTWPCASAPSCATSGRSPACRTGARRSASPGTWHACAACPRPDGVSWSRGSRPRWARASRWVAGARLPAPRRRCWSGGSAPPGAPRAGLLVQVEALLAELGMPGPATQPDAVELRLDPARSPLDRRRHVTLRRLAAVGVRYAEEREVTGVGGAQALGRRWTARWQPASAATLELAALAGPTLEQAAEGTIRRRRAELAAADELGPRAALDLVEQAAECGLAALTSELVSGLRETLLPSAGLADLIAAHTLLERVAAGHVPGLPVERQRPTDPEPYELPPDPSLGDLVLAAVTAVEGLAGSDDPVDAAALAELVRLVERGRGEPAAVGEGRLAWTLGRLAIQGSPLLQGAAAAALVLLSHADPAALGVRLGSWVDASGGHDLAGRLRGVLVMAAPLLEVCADLLDPLSGRIEGMPDVALLQRLPALRDGFEVLSATARQRFLEAVTDRIGLGDLAELERRLAIDHPRAALARWAAADVAGRAALLALDPAVLDPPPSPPDPVVPTAVVHESTVPDAAPPDPVRAPEAGKAPQTIAPLDRWRLILGREQD